ncbi:reverse transcriptase domain-containing protein, partial [Tanacetum coccineum]
MLKKPDLDEDDIPMSREEEAKFMQTFRKTRFYNDYRDRDSNRDNWRSSGRNDYNRDNYRSNTDDKPYDLQKQFNDFMKSQQSTNAFVKETFMDLKTQLETVAKNHQASIQNLETKFDRLADKQSGRPSGSLLSNTQPNPKGHNSKAYQPPNDEDEEPTPQPKIQNPKLAKETPLPKPYKLKILYPQCLRKEKIEAQYGKFLDMIRAVRINAPLIDVLAGMPNYGKLLKELISNKRKIKKISAAFLSDESSAMIQNKVPPKLRDPRSFLISCNFNKTFSCNVLADLGASINLMPYSLYAKLSLKTLKPTKMSVSLADRPFQYPVGIAENMLIEVGKFTFPANFVILEMEEDNKLSLILGRPFLHTADAVIRIKQKQLNLGTKVLEEEIFAEFDEFIAMTADENSDSESDTEEPPFEKIIINTDYKIKTSLEEPPMDLELKPLPDNMEYHKEAFAWKTTDIPGICPSFCKHKIQLLDDKKPFVQKHRRLNLNMQEVVKKEIVKLLDTVVTNENDELVPTRTVTGWRVCIDYHKLNEATAKDHFPFPFMDQMRMPIDLCNAPATFQRCMLAIFHGMIKESAEVFMDDSSVFGNSFETCLNNLDKMLQRCKDAHLVLNWEKCHFMVKEGIVLGHTVSSAGLKVYKAKIDDFSKIARPLTKLLEKDTPFDFDNECQKAFELLKEKLTCAPVIVSPNWNLPFELMCDASDFAVGASSDDSEVDDNFPGETLMEINTKDEPWFADFANYLVGDIIPKGVTYQQKNKFFSDLK